MEANQARRFLTGICNDYVETLREEGKSTTADIVAMNADAAIKSFSASESSKAVPSPKEGTGGSAQD